MNVFLDIGATLVTGPDEGPARRLARELSLSPESKSRIGAAMMTEPWSEPDAFLRWLTGNLGRAWEGCAHQAAARGLWDAQTREARAIPGAPQTMSVLLDAGLSVGLVSNIWHPYFESARQVYDGLFERAAATGPQILSCRAGVAKPAAAIYEQALAAGGRPAHETVMIGDTYETDMAPAMALGMATVWVLHRPQAEREYLERVRAGDLPQPDVVVDSITAVTPALVQQVAARRTEGGRPDAGPRRDERTFGR